MSLTKRQLEVLRIMRDRDEELVYEQGEGWVDDEKIAPRTFFALLRSCAISCVEIGQVGRLERYRLNSTGRSYLP